VFAFFMFNALFVLIVFLLQLNKDQIHVDWPLGAKYNYTFNEETHEVNNSDAHFFATWDKYCENNLNQTEKNGDLYNITRKKSTRRGISE